MTIMLGLLATVLLVVCLKHRAWAMSPIVPLSILYLFWLIPQYQSLSYLGDHLPRGYSGYAWMAFLCLLFAFIGFLLSRPIAVRIREMEGDSRDWKGIEFATALLTALSLVLAVALEAVRPEVAHLTQWTGRATIINFLAQIRIIPFALSVLLIYRKQTATRWLLLLVNLVIMAPLALVYLRRSELVNILVVVFGAYWFARGRLPRMIYIAPAFAVLMVFVFSAGEIRRNAGKIESGGGSATLVSTEVWQGVGVDSALAERVSVAPDIYNGIHAVDFISGPGTIGMGSVLWNGIVHQWVPAQFLGADFKNSLMMGYAKLLPNLVGYKGYRFRIGTNPTGIGSAFQDFGYFGALYFMLVSLLLSLLYKAAVRGDIWSQAFYLAFVPMLMISITQDHSFLVVSIPLYLGVWIVFRRISRFKYVVGRR